MSGVRRTDFTAAMQRDMYDWMFQNYVEVNPVYAQVFKIVPSTSAFDQFTTAVGLGDLLEKPESEDLKADSPLESYTVVCKNRTFGRMVRFSMESIDDAQKGGNLLKSTVGTWSEALIRTKDRFYSKFFGKGAFTSGHEIFNNTIQGVVTDSSGNYIYDGKAFFASDHPDKVGNTYSNTAGSTSLTHTNLKTYYTTYSSTNAMDERGNEIENVPNVLIVKADEIFNARTILANTLIPGSQDNDMNVLASIVNILMWQRISGSNVWILGKLGSGLLATERMSPTIDFYQDETSKDYFATLVARWGGCVVDWRPWLGGNLSTS